MEKDEWERLLQTAKSVLEHDEARQWFRQDAKVYAEREILGVDGKTLRPDRVVELDGELLVIDFKTGAEDARHKEQVYAYVHALQNMSPQSAHSIKGKLFYTDALQVVNVI
jgi:ATP-dependent exoDNAse (exonuclease V) beta subunit